jgi:UDP-3-O-[3-hydroxymyristoyl] N-acetylglucosamine deacetylase / 3-hydroxyacyl-[acyl-carrier-protein] dehydratase
MSNQKTIAQTVSLEGIGLHTGDVVRLTFVPAEADFGFVFQRTDIINEPTVKADANFVVDTSRGTTIEQNGAKVYTIEHVLAALMGLDIDNVLIKLNGPEIPIMDGSAMPFIQKLKEAGISELSKEKNYFEIKSPIVYEDKNNGVELIIVPHDSFEVSVMVDYNSPVLGSQFAKLTSLSQFETEIAASRTFCFLHEIEFLYKNNLIKGGSLDNAVVIVDKAMSESELEDLALMLNKPKVQVSEKGILNNFELHHPNEAARHKLLDVIGDLALVGRPLKGKVIASKPGHKSNVELAKLIKKTIMNSKNESNIPVYNPNDVPIFNYQQLEKILPHKHPFLLVDKVVKLTASEVVAVKNVTGDQYFFQGHFPNEPIMPGVLQLEAMAQAGGVLVLAEKENPTNWSTYFVKIENAKFKDKVVPGDTMVIRMQLTAPVRRGLCIMKGEAFVGNKMVCEATMMAQIIENR